MTLSIAILFCNAFFSDGLLFGAGSPGDMDYAVGPWIPPVSWYTPSVDTFKKMNAQPSLQAIEALVHEYIKKHGAGVHSSSGFITAAYGCPRQWGNRMHEFLNGFAIAVVTNRTLVWTYTTQGGNANPGSLEECEALLHRQAWIPSVEVIAGKPRHGFGWHNGGQKDLACTGLEYVGTGHEVINLGVTERYESFAIAANDARLSPEAASRAKLLFAYGPGAAFGTLLNKAFSYDKANIIDPTQNTMRKAGLLGTDGKRTSNSYVVGMHVRTVGRDPHEIASKFTESLVEKLKQRHPSDGPCGLLLATDNDQVKDIFAPKVAEHDCTLVTSLYDEISTSWSGEHGKHTGTGALRDLYLLSHSDTLLLSCGSTFSESIAEQMLSRNPDGALAVIGCDSEIDKQPDFTVGC